MVEESGFIEHACVYGYDYGTSEESVEALRQEGFDVLLDIDVQGGRQVRESHPEAVLVFVFPPSLEVLTRRLKDRKSDDENVITRRLNTAKEEINAYRKYQYVIINDDYEESVSELKAIIQDTGSAFRLENRHDRAEEIIKTFWEN